MRGLKIDIGRTTVVNILAETRIEPAPERTRKRTWKHFLESHWETLYTCDFFTVESLGVFGTIRYSVLFVMELRSRAVYLAGHSCGDVSFRGAGHKNLGSARLEAVRARR